MKIFVPYSLKVLCLLFLGSIFTPGQGTAQKKAIAYIANPVVYINLMLPSADSLLLVDGTGALFSDNYSANVDEYDAGKLSNFNENICLYRAGHNLAIEARPIPKSSDTLFVRMWSVRQSTYTIQVNLRSVALLLPLNAWLVDNYLHTQIPVNLLGETKYSFNPSVDSNSYLNRFMIILKRGGIQGNNIINTGTVTQLNASRVTVYPNPVAGHKLSLHFTGMSKDSYTIKFSSLSGETLFGINIMHPGGDNEYYLPLNSVYTKGIYTLTISGKNTGKIIHLPIVVN
jgi:hypothetical protein